jgi:ribonucleoside-diphosphate reductase alpha chain
MSTVRAPATHPATGRDAIVDIPLQPASYDIWDKKYRLKAKSGEPVDATIDETYQRVARALSEVEISDELRGHWYERFLWALRRGAIPAGRITSNAGALAHKPATSTINCTVSGTIRDSMDDILEKVHEAGLTLKAGCGIGYEFSTLRPRNAYVSGAGAYTSGPLSFMDIYDKMCFTVSSAGGRRGAQMGTFDISHPDAKEFIRAKREDGRLRQFNLSLLITDGFMDAVEHDQDWPLVFPVHIKEKDEVDLADPAQVVWREWPTHENYIDREDGLVACKIYSHIRARHLWDMIMVSTYDYAEPGFILIDKVNEMNNNWWCEHIRATNPCVTADTWVQTSAGPRQVADLLGHGFMARVDGKDHATGAEGFFRTATKPVLALQTEEGHRLRLTEDHRVRRVSRLTRWSVDTEWCAAAALQPGDRVLLNDHRANAQWPGALTAEQGYLLGLLVGDGTLKHETAVLSVWPQAAVVNGSVNGGARALMAETLRCAQTLPHRADFAGWSEVAGRREFRMKSAALRDLAFEFGMSVGDKSITPALEQASSDACRGFLRGFFDADGSVQGSQAKGVSVRLAQSDLPRLEAVQRMLLRLGMPSRICRDRRVAGENRLPDGHGGMQTYAIRAQHELVIAGESVARFAELIGFADADKATRLKAALSGYKRTLNRERFVATVVSLQADGVEDVYDVQVPGINTFDGNGLHAHNCGEQPLPPYGSCLLGSVNLTTFVRDAFGPKARFDWDEYREVVKVFTRMLDNVVEINGLPLEQQRHEIIGKRRHGMGFLGLGSTVTMLKMRYGDAEAVAFTEEVSREMAVAGWEVALELAREKGAAPVLLRDYTVTGDMLRKRPEMASDGYKVGDSIPGRVLHAKYSRYMQRIATVAPNLVEQLAETGARFTHHSSIAPTGTISLSLANNASNGIEPSFAHSYSRNVIREGKKSKEKVEVLSYELLAYRALINADAKAFTDEAANKLPDYFVAADDISPKQHVDIQAASQKWIDSSISKTANVPTDYPYEDFKDIYFYAYKQGLKGCTTFRFNPAAFQGVLVKDSDLENTLYRFELEDGSVVELKGNEQVEYDGEMHSAANLFDALKEGYYGKF